ncbi:MAG: hypothetical protein H6945_15090 [Zoogloeaceae bacterium]|nr:hypothetical protein [Rhodocyclaceae bacterium]MCP5237060.1 hypothetical protein [Zoogloeaceae bacterium]
MRFEILPRLAMAQAATIDRVIGGLGFGPVAGSSSVVLEVEAPLLEAGGPAVCLLRDGEVESEGRAGRVRYRIGEGLLFGCLQVSESEFGADSPARLADATRAAYGAVFDCLETLGCRHLVRVWNYLPRINDVEHGEERYRRFNAGRQQAFEAAGRALIGAVPAACALGTGGDQLKIAFLAARGAFVPIENPRQTSAYRYPIEYGERSPTFSRAALLSHGGVQLLMISGTAAIVGHRSLHGGDVLAQTREAIANIEAVLAQAGECSPCAGLRLADLDLTVYLRRRADLAPVSRLLAHEHGLPRRPLFVEADVCRSELLVEIEAYGECAA